MSNAWQRYLEVAGSMTETTRKRAESVVRALVKQGEIASDRAEKAVDDLLSRSEANRKAVTSIVRTETEKAVGRLGLARQSDVDRLARRVEKLEQQTGGAKKSASKKSASKKSAAKKSAAKKTSPPKKSGPGSAGSGGGTGGGSSST